MEMIRFEMDKDKYGRPPSNKYIIFWLEFFLDAIRNKDIDYFQGDVFEYHFNILPDAWFCWFLGLEPEEITIDLMRELLIRRIQNDN